MGDARLRELERRWTETQAPADEAAYLRARLHAGTLTRSQVELWAYCERPAALLALPDPGPAPPAQLMRWVEGLERFGRRPCAAAAVAALAFVWPALEALPPHILEPLARARVLAEEWVRSPSFAVRSRVDEAAQAVRFELHDLRSPPDRRRMNAHHALKAALDTIVGDGFAARAATCVDLASPFALSDTRVNLMNIGPSEALVRAVRAAVEGLVL